jgi:hypothetical protein
MKRIYLVDVMIYAASKKFALPVYQDYFNFQVPLPNILNILVFGVSYCFCQKLEVVRKWALFSGIVPVMPCNYLPQISFIHTSLYSTLSLISTLSSEISHFLNFSTASTLVSILRVDFQVNW